MATAVAPEAIPEAEPELQPEGPENSSIQPDQVEAAIAHGENPLASLIVTGEQAAPAEAANDNAENMPAAAEAPVEPEAAAMPEAAIPAAEAAAPESIVAPESAAVAPGPAGIPTVQAGN